MVPQRATTAHCQHDGSLVALISSPVDLNDIVHLSLRRPHVPLVGNDRGRSVDERKQELLRILNSALAVLEEDLDFE